MVKQPNYIQSASLGFYVPNSVSAATVLDMLPPDMRALLASVFMKRNVGTKPGHKPSGTTRAVLNFHTIMEAEAMLDKYPYLMFRGVRKALGWTLYGADPVLLLHPVPDFPVDALLSLLVPFCTVTTLFKVSECADFVIVRTATVEEARTAQRNLHGTLFRGIPLYVGSERPGFYDWGEGAYHGIKLLVPDVLGAIYEGPGALSDSSEPFPQVDAEQPMLPPIEDINRMLEEIDLARVQQ